MGRGEEGEGEGEGEVDKLAVPTTVRIVEEQEHSRLRRFEDATEANLLKLIADSQDTTKFVVQVLHRDGWRGFMTRLQGSVAEKEAEIQGLCDSHYQDFIRSVDELLSVRMEAMELKHTTRAINDRVQAAGKALVQKEEKLEQHRRAQRDIQRVQLSVVHVQAVLSEFRSVQEQVKARKYLLALKSTLHVQHVMLPALNLPSITTVLSQQASSLCERIRQAGLNDFASWLQRARDNALAVGRQAINQHEERNLVRASQTPRVKAKDEQGRSQIAVSKLSNKKADSEQAGDVFGQVQLSFAAVNQCLHIHQDLDATDAFRRHYIDVRKQQVVLDFHTDPETNPMLSEKDQHVEFHGDKLTEFLTRFIGFFVIENTIFKSAPALVTRSQLGSLWELASAEAKSSVLEAIQHITKLDQLMFVKTTLNTTCLTLQLYEYDTSVLEGIHATLHELWTTISHWMAVEKIQQIYLEGVYQPLTVHTPEQFKETVAPLCLHGDEPIPSFPHTFSFSQMVVETCGMVLETVNSNFDVMEEASSRAAAQMVDEIMLEGVNQALHRIIDGSAHFGLSQAVQLSHDAKSYASFCAVLERYIAHRGKLHASGSQQGALACERALLETSKRSWDQVHGAARRKAAEFVSFDNLDWAPQVKPTEPTDGLQDLLMFTASAFSSLTLTDEQMAELSATFQEFLCTALWEGMKAAKRINDYGVIQLELDVRELEAHADQYADRHPPLLKKMRQVTDLLLGPNITGILDEQLRSTLYDCVDLVELRGVMERFVKGQSALQKMKGQGHHSVIDKKQVDALVKQLKQLET